MNMSSSRRVRRLAILVVATLCAALVYRLYLLNVAVSIGRFSETFVLESPMSDETLAHVLGEQREILACLGEGWGAVCNYQQSGTDIYFVANSKNDRIDVVSELEGWRALWKIAPSSHELASDFVGELFQDIETTSD